MGKIIYESSGKAAEYGKYAFSAYLGCSCGCTYCFNKTGRFKAVLGGDTPKLKKYFRDESHAMQIFEKELLASLPELQKHGLFFCFVTDPLLPETMLLTEKACLVCWTQKVPVKILTKRADACAIIAHEWHNDMVAVGLTLTGHDELEPNASPNAERIEAMKKLHDAGFKTFVSAEPIVDFESSLKMIDATKDFCSLYKIGLESGKKHEEKELRRFVVKALAILATIPNPNEYIVRKMLSMRPEKAFEYSGKIYFKDGLLKAAGINREDLPSCCVTRDYNLFSDK
jgi:DNA repair photolyase